MRSTGFTAAALSRPWRPNCSPRRTALSLALQASCWNTIPASTTRATFLSTFTAPKATARRHCFTTGATRNSTGPACRKGSIRGLQLQLPASNATVQWAFYFNDTAGNWNSTGVQHFAVTENGPWWNSSFAYARLLNVTNNNDSLELDANYTANVTLDTQNLIAAGKMRADCSDLAVFDKIAAKEIDRAVAGCYSGETQVLFKLQRAITPSGSSADYALEYGNTQNAPFNNNEAVYWLYDDFNDNSINESKWVCDYGTCTEAGGVVTVGGISDNRLIALQRATLQGGLNHAKLLASVSTSAQTTSNFGFDVGNAHQVDVGYSSPCTDCMFISDGVTHDTNDSINAYGGAQKKFVIYLNGTRVRAVNLDDGSYSDIDTGRGQNSEMRVSLYDWVDGYTSFDEIKMMKYIYPEPSYALESEQQR